MRKCTCLLVFLACFLLVGSNNLAHATLMTSEQLVTFYDYYEDSYAFGFTHPLVVIPLTGDTVLTSVRLEHASAELEYLGRFLYHYTPFIPAPGTTSIWAGLQPLSGTVDSQMDVRAWIEVLDAGTGGIVSTEAQTTSYRTVNSLVTPALGGLSGAVASFSVPVVSLDLGVMDLSYTVWGGVWADSGLWDIKSTLVYGPSGGDAGDYKSIEFSVADGGELQLNLDQPGVWDMWFTPLYLEGRWLSRAQVSETLDLRVLLWDVGLASWGPSIIHFPDREFVVSQSNYEKQVFSIVVIPEPSTIALFGIGIAGVLGLMRRRLGRLSA